MSADVEAPDISPENLAFAEEMYRVFVREPASVSEPWRRIFRSFGPPPPEAERGPIAAADGVRACGLASALGAERARRLVDAYRRWGHLAADLDPLGLAPRDDRELALGVRLDAAELDSPVAVEGWAGGAIALRDLIARLRETYCRHIAVEAAHIHDREAREWVHGRMEEARGRLALSPAERRRILEMVTRAEALERFFAAKLVGAKRFSIEGAESLVPLLDRLVEGAARAGIEEVVAGMAHRGRINVLCNVLGKPVAEILDEFLDRPDGIDWDWGGDVKYHLGHSCDREAGGRRVHLSLSFNPSHLEWVDPVVLGRARAKQDRLGDAGRSRVLPLLVHGDAAFAGQGVVAESLLLSGVPGTAVGGAVHVVVDNRIGFTTSPRDAYGSSYATAAARALESPIFHVNGEDPESLALAAELALEFRQRFHRDVVIDLWCYRRHGHNEGDEPTFTQPEMYRAIAGKRSVREIYVDSLCGSGDGEGPSRAEAEAMAAAERLALEAELEKARAAPPSPPPASFAGSWAGYRGGPESQVPDVATQVAAGALRGVARALTELPAGFTLHPKLRKPLEARAAMAEGRRPIDWSMGEALAFGTLLAEGRRVRLTGQDTRRGTFSQRHAVLVDPGTGAEHTPLAALGAFEVRDSPLSEAGALGFEYGYSLDMPEGLVVWEAQFGDFVNAAQVVVDQFLCSSEAKWRRCSGLVLLLPHGMEGQGPEHSSARLERFLNLAVADNMQVCSPTTPAQLFHLLRRQVLRPWRKPLVVMSPKSLLRHPAAVSSLEDLTAGGFRHVIPDQAVEPGRAARVLLCTGKIYYELDAARREKGRDDVAIVRVEQLYPLRRHVLLNLLAAYREGSRVVWVQEEPRNFGAWSYMNRHLPPLLRGIFGWSCVSRPPSASPATGSTARHRLEQAMVIDHALGEGGTHG